MPRFTPWRRLIAALSSDDTGEARAGVVQFLVLAIGAIFVLWFVWTQVRFWLMVIGLAAVVWIIISVVRRFPGSD